LKGGSGITDSLLEEGLKGYEEMWKEGHEIRRRRRERSRQEGIPYVSAKRGARGSKRHLGGKQGKRGQKSRISLKEKKSRQERSPKGEGSAEKRRTLRKREVISTRE